MNGSTITVGRIKVDGLTCREVIQQINARLKDMKIEFGESEFSDLSYINSVNQNRYDSMPWPSDARWIACFAVEGSNEGIYIHIEALFPKGHGSLPNVWQSIALAKVWQWPNAHEIVAKTTEILADARWG
jgi:hypothetical protein